MIDKDNFDIAIYVMPKIKWYKKIWYFITDQKDKLKPQWKPIGGINIDD